MPFTSHLQPLHNAGNNSAQGRPFAACHVLILSTNLNLLSKIILSTLLPIVKLQVRLASARALPGHAPKNARAYGIAVPRLNNTSEVIPAASDT